MENTYKLYTGETINYELITFFKENVLDVDIVWKCLQVDKDNLIKASRSIRFDGVAQNDITTEDDYYGLMVHYCDIRFFNNKYYVMLMFDEYDEQDYHLVYKLTDEEIEEYKQDNNVWLYIMLKDYCSDIVKN